MLDITPVIQAVIALIAAVLTIIVIPYIKSKTSAQQQAETEAWVKIAVSAAEQLYSGTGWGVEKKAYVQRWLREHGVILDESKAEALIEGAVYQLTGGVSSSGGEGQGESRGEGQ